MKKNLKILVLLVVALGLIVSYSCQKEMFKSTTTDDVNIAQYLERYPERYSLLSEILEKSNTIGFLGAYGTYTLFAPDNNAVNAWIQQNGKSSLNDFSSTELLDFVKYHVIKDTVGTTRFTDGKIKSPTLFGEYLYTDVSGGTYRINKAAQINKSNIVCGNGLIHALDKALVPPVKDLARLIENNPDYSIFTAALKATGFYDTLSYNRGNAISAQKRFQTVLVQSDSLYHVMGINSFEDLKARYSTKNDPKLHSDSLWLYIAYHINNGNNFMEDIAGTSTIYTLAPREIVSTKLTGTKVLLNEAEFNGVLEPGVEINRSKSDQQASNGVLHEIKNNLYIKVRLQLPVYFDVATSPELLTALGSSYQNSSVNLVKDGAVIASSISFNSLLPSQIETNKYQFDLTPNSTRPFANSDILSLSMCTANSARIKYVDIKTPYLVKGRYKVWICYVALNTNSPTVQVTYDPGKESQQILPNIVDFRDGLNLSGVATANLNDVNADNFMLAQGYKRYMATTAEINANGTRGVKQISGTGANLNVGRLAGIINVETTDRHIIRLDAIGGGCTNNYMSIDMIHFIPADDPEQNYPRFHPKRGELFYRPQ